MKRALTIAEFIVVVKKQIEQGRVIYPLHDKKRLTSLNIASQRHGKRCSGFSKEVIGGEEGGVLFTRRREVNEKKNDLRKQTSWMYHESSLRRPIVAV